MRAKLREVPDGHHDPSSALVPVAPVLTNAEWLALAGFLAGYSGLTRRRLRSVPENASNERVDSQRIRLADGRTVGFADYGTPAAAAVLWCHGGPGSRVEPAYLAAQATQAGLRIIGIDRPGYGLSTPRPGRTIAGCVSEALAVADYLGIGQFAAVGTSTGGAYALALAALAPGRVLGVVACCSND